MNVWDFLEFALIRDMRRYSGDFPERLTGLLRKFLLGIALCP